mmetsp:Transcript_100906/g.184015  ORF Transcript_100906/g.184015 Transcript_100906/m.184015 type:complete len:209 (+) Transcript_100906:418-1044(+)
MVYQSVHAHVGWVIRVVEHGIAGSSAPCILAAITVAFATFIPSKGVRALISLQTIDFAHESCLNDVACLDVLTSENSKPTPRRMRQNDSAIIKHDRSMSNSCLLHMSAQSNLMQVVRFNSRHVSLFLVQLSAPREKIIELVIRQMNFICIGEHRNTFAQIGNLPHQWRACWDIFVCHCIKLEPFLWRLFHRHLHIEVAWRPLIEHEGA